MTLAQALQSLKRVRAWIEEQGADAIGGNGLDALKDEAGAIEDRAVRLLDQVDPVLELLREENEIG